MTNSHDGPRASINTETNPEGRRTRPRLLSRKPLGGLILGAATIFFVFSGVAAAQSDNGSSKNGPKKLEDAVLGEMSQRAGDDSSGSGQRSAASTRTLDSTGTQVNVMRKGKSQSGEWAFGSSVIEAPKKKGYHPEGWLFVAKNDGGNWEVELEGNPEFSQLAGKAPTSVVGNGEKKVFASGTGSAGQETETSTTRSTSAASTPTRTGLMLPWAGGTKWNFTSGPHGWSGYDRPYAALDFVGRGGDQKVRAAGGGKVYRMCGSGKGWVRVYHSNGLSTDYYHLWATAQYQNGRGIGRGTVLGVTGEDASCGGAAYGRHVHFALLQGQNHTAVHNRIIGGWTFKEGSEAYRGYTQRSSTLRYPGSIIKNHGVS